MPSKVATLKRHNTGIFYENTEEFIVEEVGKYFTRFGYDKLNTVSGRVEAAQYLDGRLKLAYEMQEGAFFYIELSYQGEYDPYKGFTYGISSGGQHVS